MAENEVRQCGCDALVSAEIELVGWRDTKMQRVWVHQLCLRGVVVRRCKEADDSVQFMQRCGA